MLLEPWPNVLCQGEVKSKLPSNFLFAFTVKVIPRGVNSRIHWLGQQQGMLLYYFLVHWFGIHTMHCTVCILCIIHVVLLVWDTEFLLYKALCKWFPNYHLKHITHLPSNTMCFTVKISESVRLQFADRDLSATHSCQRSSAFETSPFLILTGEKKTHQNSLLFPHKIEENKLS